MIFRETTQEDLDFMADNSMSRGIQKYCPEQIELVYTLEHEGKPLGVGGFRLINTTTAWCWVDMSHESGKHLTVSYRTIKEWMEKLAEEHNIKRLQAYVECDFPDAIRMVEHLGFTKESTMENFVGDRDSFLYKRIL